MAKADFSKGVSVILEGTTNWAQLTEASGPNKFSEKYQVDLTLNESSAKQLEGLKILEFLNLKREDGSLKYEKPTIRLKTNNPPTIYDTSKTLYTGFIGNDSVMRVRALIKSWEMMGKKGLTCYFNQGVLLQLNTLDLTDDSELWEGVEVTEMTSQQQEAVDAANAPAPAPAAAEAVEEDSDLPF